MFDSVSSNVSGKVTSTITGNRKVIMMFLAVLILVEFLPMGVLSPSQRTMVTNAIKPVLNPVTNLMSNVYVRLLLFVVLLWSCFVKKDINLFLLISVYFVMSRK